MISIPKIGRVGQPTYEPGYLTIILEVKPLINNPKTIPVKPKLSKLEAQLRSFVENELSIKQMADRLGMSKSWIIEQLRRHGITLPKTGRMTNPKNYRHHLPPFGYKVRDGVLVPCTHQQKTCQLILKLRKSESMSFSAIARQLTQEGHQNSLGTTYWDNKSVKKIYERWKEKY